MKLDQEQVFFSSKPTRPARSFHLGLRAELSKQQALVLLLFWPPFLGSFASSQL
jgi:hypothetical protein